MDETDLLNLIKYFIKRIKLIILITIISFIIGFIYVKFNNSSFNNYYGTKIILLDSSNNKILQDKTKIILSSKNLNTISYMVKSKEVITKLINNLELDYNFKDISNNVSAEFLHKSYAIKINYYNQKKEEVEIILNELGNIVSQEIYDNYNIKTLSSYNLKISKLQQENNKGMKILLLFPALGIFITIILLFLIYYFNFRIESISSIENIGFKILGTIPKNKKLSKFEKIKCKLLLEKQKNNFSSILVFGPSKKIGNSFVVNSLAHALANSNMRVLIIECQTKYNNSNYIINSTDNSNLSKLIMNEKDLNFSNKDFKEKYSSYSKNYDLILIDSKSLDETYESILASKFIDKIIIVCYNDRTTLKSLKNLNEMLLEAEVKEKVLGVVVNNSRE